VHRQGARVRVADSRSAPPFAAELKRSAPGAVLLTGSFNDELIDGAELIGLSPGLSLNEPVVGGGRPARHSRRRRD
jgi:UDP-N-acetylmuramoylalanine--D-glutamate ligase